MRSLTGLDWTTLVLVIIGGLNWGLVGFSQNFDMVARLLGGAESIIARIVYWLIGLSALYLVFAIGSYARK